MQISKISRRKDAVSGDHEGRLIVTLPFDECLTGLVCASGSSITQKTLPIRTLPSYAERSQRALYGVVNHKFAICLALEILPLHPHTVLAFPIPTRAGGGEAMKMKLRDSRYLRSSETRQRPCLLRLI